jgi:hypothetical protein
MQKQTSDISNSTATGTISKSFGEHLNNMSGQHDIKDLQKTVILGTTSERANVKVQNVYYGKEHYI